MIAPIWIDKLEEAQYSMSKVKPKLDKLGSLHARHLLHVSLDELRRRNSPRQCAPGNLQTDYFHPSTHSVHPPATTSLRRGQMITVVCKMVSFKLRRIMGFSLLCNNFMKKFLGSETRRPELCELNFAGIELF